jgi:hypothetical protein
MANNEGRSPAGLSYSLRVLGSPWTDSAIINADGIVFWPVRFFPERWQWFLRYITTNKQVLIGDEVKKVGIVGEIRMCGRIRVDYAEKQTWVSPNDIGARWLEYQAGRLARVYGEMA